MHWDYALILLFFATAVPLLGLRRIRRLIATPETTKRDRLGLYASTITFQWLATAIILWRVAAHGISVAMLGVALPRPELATLITLLLAALVLANQFASLRRITTHPETVRGSLPQIAMKIFPQDSTERLAFLVVVVTVAICEELIFRGFTQRVLEDWGGGAMVAGIAGSAALFSLAHLYQGRRGVLTTFVVGLLFAGIRSWTGSLLGPFVAHFLADLTAGFLAPPRIRTALSAQQPQAGATASVI